MTETFPSIPTVGLPTEGADVALAAALNSRWAGGQTDVAVPASRSAHLIYWKKCDRENCVRHNYRKRNAQRFETGWIVVGEDPNSDPWAFQRYTMQKHMTPLLQYGRMPMGETGASNPALRFKQLVEFGGIIEFPAEQLIAFGWDRLPEVQRLRPDVKNVKRMKCSYGTCGGREFLSEADVARHQKVYHEKSEGTESIARAFAAQADARDSASRLSTEDLKSISVAVAQAIIAAQASLSEAR